MTEDCATRRRRLKMRSWRRGTKEMDLILGRFWDAEGASLDASTLDLYEAMLAENDRDLYEWVSGQAAAPAKFAPLINRLIVR